MWTSSKNHLQCKINCKHKHDNIMFITGQLSVFDGLHKHIAVRLSCLSIAKVKNQGSATLVHLITADIFDQCLKKRWSYSDR